MMALALALLGGLAPAAEPPLAWASPNRHRVLLRVDTRGIRRSGSVAAVELDLAAEMAARGEPAAVDPDTIEVVAYDATGRPRVYDDFRAGDERYLLPWRIERSYPTGQVTLSFVLSDSASIRYAVYFDSVESSRGRPERYPGLVGDGDLDLLEGGVEPYVRVFENKGGSRFVDRGWLTSAGKVLFFPATKGIEAGCRWRPPTGTATPTRTSSPSS